MKSMENKFLFTSKAKVPFYMLMVIGILAAIIGLATYGFGNRFWANILLNNYYFLALALGGVFFVAVHAIAESGWHTSVQRIPEAMGAFIPVAGILMLIMIIFGNHYLYPWTHKEHLDPVLEGKSGYLNMPFFIIRFFVYFAGWTALSYFMRKNSLQQDLDTDLKYFKRHNTFSALFIVFFAITVVTSSWDWLMSIDAHWFSTLYGWYILSGLMVSSVAMIILIILALRIAGLMKHINKEHLHDLGKYLFGFSIFWAYLWFSQYLLIWYGNLPEETIYYFDRLSHFNGLFYVNIIFNFAAPFLVLMTRNSKRTSWILGIAAILVFIGHWIDYYQAIIPGVVGKENGIGWFEVELTLGYLGLFIFIVLRALSRANIVPVHHPFFKESLEYHTNY